MTFRVVPTDYRASAIVSPQSPVALDTPVRVSYVGDEKFLATVDRAGGDPYTVTALVRTTGDDEDGALTINRLRAAGTAYPPEITRQYLGVPEGAIPEGGDAEQLLENILAEVEDPGNPYDVASTMVDYLQSSANFKYDPDVRDLTCEGLSIVECFARYREGYCQYYATTMAILLRAARHPDAPGCRVPARQTRCAPLRARVGQRRACMGRGLLPRVRLGGVRPDGRRPRRCGAAADRRTGSIEGERRPEDGRDPERRGALVPGCVASLGRLDQRPATVRRVRQPADESGRLHPVERVRPRKRSADRGRPCRGFPR